MRLHALIILILVALAGQAGGNMKFRHISTSDGLSDNNVNHITRDSQGFMWFSTSYGLNRYDGHTFKTFTFEPGNKNSLSRSVVLGLYEDGSGLLWVEYWIGLYNCYDPLKDTFRDARVVMKEKYGIGHAFTKLFVDKDKDLWLQNDTVGTLYHDISGNKTVCIPVSGHARDMNLTVTAFGEDKSGILRMYSNGFFDHIDKRSGRVDYSNDDIPARGNVNSRGYNIFADNDGDYWIYCDTGILLYLTKERRWETIDNTEDSPYRLNGNIVRSLACDMEGRVWIAIDHGGINIIDRKRRSIEYVVHDNTDDESLVQNNVLCLYADSEGGMWAGTFKRGISYYDEHMFKFHTEAYPEFQYQKDFIPDISSITEDNDGNLYVGVPEKLIFSDIRSGKNSIIGIPPSLVSLREDEILSLACDGCGNIWIATYQGGLICYNPASGSFFKKKLDPADTDSDANRSIWAFANDRNGYLWIGTWGEGLWGLDPLSGEITRFTDPGGNFNQEMIADICISRDGNLYMATPNGMLVYYPSSKRYEKMFGTKDGKNFFHGSILSHIEEDGRGLLWISSFEGLSIYDRQNDRVSFLNDRMRKTVVHGVVEDDDNNMWISSSDGIYHVIVSGKSGEYDFNLCKYRDSGIPQKQQFNPRALIKTRSGRLAFGGIKGLSVIDPSNLKYKRATHRPVFTDLQIRNRSVAVDSVYQGRVILEHPLNREDGIELGHNQNTFTVTFSSMNYSSSGNAGYLYMLDGFDQDWISTADNKASYSNLSPGDYVLKVKEVGEDGMAGDLVSELKISIAPPFYRSWPALIIYMVVLVLGVMLVRAHLKHNEAQRYKLMKIQQEADKKHEIDDMKLRFFTNISHDLRTPLTLILTPLEYVSEHLDNPELLSKVRIARNNALRLLGMVNQLLDFRKSDMSEHRLSATGGDIVEVIRKVCDNFIEYSEYHDINLTFFSRVKSLYMLFDKDKIDKIIMNLLSNAFKFTPEGGRVDVSIDVENAEGERPETLEIKVADNGCGISDEYKERIFDRFFQVPRPKTPKSVTGSGIGLNLVKEFVTLHGGDISVCDNIGKGSVFIVRIPITRVESGLEPAPDAKENPVEAVPVDDDGMEGKDDGQRRASVLVVDDNDDFRQFMADCLKSDYTVHTAADGTKAWEMIPELQPDIVVSDVMMPGMDGNELCARIKNDVRTSHILVVLLSARSAKEHEQKGLEVGADDYITKPFNLNVLGLRIRNLLQRRHNSQAGTLDISPSRINITSLDEKLIAKAIRYVDENLGRSDLSVEELSGELGMSRVHLYKKLLSITGKTPVEFIRVMRLKRAGQLLRESQLNVSEIAYQTGFNNLGLFRKYFKKEYGILPSEFQARYARHKS